jgi:hypothetical protein
MVSKSYPPLHVDLLHSADGRANVTHRHQTVGDEELSSRTLSDSFERVLAVRGRRDNVRVDRLAIICVLCEQDKLDKETKAGGQALYSLYTRPKDFGRDHVMDGRKVALYHVQCKLNTNKDVVNSEWDNADRVDKIAGGDEVGGDRGKLGVYLMAHSAGVDLHGFHPHKVPQLLETLKLGSVEKLCLIACKGGFGDEQMNQDTALMDDKGNPSILYSLCQHLGQKGVKPKIAGWKGFVSVVSGNRPDEKHLQVHTKPRQGNEIGSYEEHTGRKIIRPNPNYKNVLTKSDTGKEAKKAQKIYYVWNNGVKCLANEDWTDK